MSSDPEPPKPPALPVTGTVGAEQLAAHATGGHAGHAPLHPQCENCGTKLEGRFCHQCGQHDFDLHRSFRHVFLEALDTLFNLDGRFFRSIITLLFHPGRLTADFNAGKRAAQMPPFRLYIFVSFLFFLVIFLGGNGEEFIRETGKPHQGITLNGQPLTFGKTTTPVKPGDRQEPASTDDAQARAEDRRSAGQEQPALRDDLEEQGRRLNDPAHRQRLSERIQANLPHLLMLCLPCFALFTRLLFRKSGLMYLQHLVLALHFHTFIYLWVVCRKGWAGLVDLPGWGLGGWLTLACNLWLWVYPVLMLRRLFANSWPVTVLKSFLLAFGYGLTLGLGFMVMTAVALLLT